MASDPSFAEYVRDQLHGAGAIALRRMFGEYAVYCNTKVVGFICDNKLFVKPTEAGRAYLRHVVEQPPYPGAKNYFLIDEQLDEQEFVMRLVQLTADELPFPAPKKPRKPRAVGKPKA